MATNRKRWYPEAEVLPRDGSKVIVRELKTTYYVGNGWEFGYEEGFEWRYATPEEVEGWVEAVQGSDEEGEE